MPAARSYAGRSAQQRRAERRDRLLAAGLELFGTAGYRGTSIEALCTSASVSTRAFYEEFASREALLLALHDQVTTRGLAAALAEATRLAGAPMAERVAAVVAAYVGAVCSEQRAARIAFVEVLGVSPAVEAHRLVWRGRMVEFVQGIAADAVERGEAPPREYSHTAIAIIGAFNELVAEWVQRGRQVPIEVVSGEVTRLVVAVMTVA